MSTPVRRDPFEVSPKGITHKPTGVRYTPRPDADAEPLDNNLKGSILMLRHFDRPPPGWFVLDIARREERKWDWAALLVDVEPANLKYCHCDLPALLYVDPADYRPAERQAEQCWVNIPGKHRSWKAAMDAIRAAMAASLS